MRHDNVDDNNIYAGCGLQGCGFAVVYARLAIEIKNRYKNRVC